MIRILRAAVFAALAVPSAGAAEQAQPFRVFSEDGPPEARRMSVRLEHRLTAAELASIADSIKAHQPAGKTAALVAFFLPGAKGGERAWAEAKFGSATQVTINGLRQDEEEAFKATAARDGRDVIGHWLTSPPALSGMLTIAREKSGKLTAEWNLRNGQKTADEVVESRAHNGRRFDVVGGGGSYYLATWGGPLELGQKSSVIAVAERLQVDKPLAANTKKDAGKQQQPAKPAEDDAKLANAVSAPSAESAPLANTAAAPAADKSTKSHRAHQAAKGQETPKRTSSGSSLADLAGAPFAR